MSTNQYGEPWKIYDKGNMCHPSISDYSIIDCNTKLVQDGWDCDMKPSTKERVILCVNACAGIPDETLAKLAAANADEEVMAKFLKLAIATLSKHGYEVYFPTDPDSDSDEPLGPTTLVPSELDDIS